MKENNEESIYEYISKMAEENPGLPYRFQYISSHGAMDVNYVMWEDKLSISEKEKCSKDLMDVVIEYINKAGSYEVDKNLSALLEVKPIYMYLSNLSHRIKLTIEENLVEVQDLYSFAIDLATESQEMEKVKLGMMILGFFENDLSKKIIRILGYHSAFTLYAVETAKNFTNYNEFLFQLVQNTEGFGKLISLSVFQPVHLNQKDWIFNKGALNQVAPNMSAILCLEKIDMMEYYNNLKITDYNFSELSYLIAYASEESDIKKLTLSLELVFKYMEVADKYANSFIDLAAIVTIDRSMDPHWEIYDEDIEKENGWSSNKEFYIWKKSKKLIAQNKWKYIILNELNEPNYELSLILLVSRKINFTPDFKVFNQYFMADPFDMEIFEFMVIDNVDYYLENVMAYVKEYVSDEVFSTGPQNIEEDNLTQEYKPDIWILYLLKALINSEIYDEIFFLKCFTSRYQNVRIEAIKALRHFKAEWSERVIPKLEKALEVEPVEKVQSRIKSLLPKKKAGLSWQQTYIDPREIEISSSSSKDIFLFKTRIAGTNYRDMTVVEGLIKDGDILYLKREPENPYDKKAIIVTADDGYILGYIPRAQNKIPATLMDGGESLYAILKSDTLEVPSPSIDIMLSKK